MYVANPLQEAFKKFTEYIVVRRDTDYTVKRLCFFSPFLVA